MTRAGSLLVQTLNSTYRVEEVERDGRAAFAVTKVAEARAGSIGVGDHYLGHALAVRRGEPMVLRGVVEHHHPGRACGKHHTLRTSLVTSVTRT